MSMYKNFHDMSDSQRQALWDAYQHGFARVHNALLKVEEDSRIGATDDETDEFTVECEQASALMDAIIIAAGGRPSTHSQLGYTPWWLYDATPPVWTVETILQAGRD